MSSVILYTGKHYKLQYSKRSTYCILTRKPMTMIKLELTTNDGVSFISGECQESISPINCGDYAKLARELYLEALGNGCPVAHSI
jgi:hypothetical protein